MHLPHRSRAAALPAALCLTLSVALCVALPPAGPARVLAATATADSATTDSAAADTSAAGPARNPAYGYEMVLIHTIGSSADVWDDMLPLLQIGYRVWTFELPGHGHTRPIKNLTVQSAARELARFIHENGIGYPILVGHGMGGLIAMDYTFHHPDAVKRLIVIDAAPKQLATREQKERVAYQLLHHYDRFVAGYFQGMSPRKDIADRIVDQALRTDQISFTELLLSSFDFDLTDLLPRQSVPILVIGSATFFPDPDNARATLNQMGWDKARSIAFKTMPGCGTFVMLEQPTYTASVIIAFSEAGNR